MKNDPIINATPERVRQIENIARASVFTLHDQTGCTHLSALVSLVQVHAVDARNAFAGYEPLRPQLASMFRALADGIEDPSAEPWPEPISAKLFAMTTEIFQLANALNADAPQA